MPDGGDILGNHSPRTSPCRCGENMAPRPPPPPLRGCNVVARPSIESSGVDAMQAYGVGGGSEGRRRSAATENRNRSRLGPNGE